MEEISKLHIELNSPKESNQQRHFLCFLQDEGADLASGGVTEPVVGGKLLGELQDHESSIEADFLEEKKKT